MIPPKTYKNNSELEFISLETGKTYRFKAEIDYLFLQKEV